jgi:hypothetical protein
MASQQVSLMVNPVDRKTVDRVETLMANPVGRVLVRLMATPTQLLYELLHLKEIALRNLFA